MFTNWQKSHQGWSGTTLINGTKQYKSMKAKFPISNFQFQQSHASLPLDSSLIGWLAGSWEWAMS